MRHNDYAFVQIGLVLVSGLLFSWNALAGLLAFLFFLLPLMVSIQLGVSRQRTGWMWGLFLNWLGVLILACMRPIVPAVREP